MKIKLCSIFVDDQEKALKFYTDTLGFVKKFDMPINESTRWLTVISPEEPEGTELVLEPSSNPAVTPFKEALFKQGIPFTAFQVDDIKKEFDRLRKLGVEFAMQPTKTGPIVAAIFNDTCGNLIQIYQV